MSGAWTMLRGRRVLFVALGVLILLNAAVLVSYQSFYDVRFRSLLETQQQLRSRRDAARKAAENAQGAEARLAAAQQALDRFFNDSLGTRKDRLASFIEEVYATTRRVGMRPDSISYAGRDEGGTDSVTVTFNVSGRYADLKKLLADFEKSPRFLVLDQVSLTSDPAVPDTVSVSLRLTHYFRPDGALHVRRERGGARAAAKTPAAAARPRPAAGEAEP